MPYKYLPLIYNSNGVFDYDFDRLFVVESARVKEKMIKQEKLNLEELKWFVKIGRKNIYNSATHSKFACSVNLVITGISCKNKLFFKLSILISSLTLILNVLFSSSSGGIVYWHAAAADITTAE